MTIGKCISTDEWEERDYTEHILDFDLAESYFTRMKWEGRKTQLFFSFACFKNSFGKCPLLK